jgi:glycosyltransferase involved in cell wall biosynthesis
MRICLFTDADVFAGTERHILDLARGLRREGAEIAIAAPIPSVLCDKAREADLPFVPIQKCGTLDRAAIRTLRQALDAGEFDLIHAHNGRTALSTALALQRARRGAGIATQHFLEPHHATMRGPKGRVAAAAHRWVSRKMDHFIAISGAVRDEMLARGEIGAEKLSVVPNGIEPPDVAGLTPAKAVRQELNIAPDAPLIACAARLEREKDIGSLIAAMATVSRVVPAARCVVAGEGVLKNELQEQIRERRLTANVTLLGYRQDVLSIIRAADIFVLPSLAEPFGLVILEALATSRPVIATDAGGPREILVHGETGILTPPSDPAALAENILSLLARPEERGRLSDNGHRRFCAAFTAGRMASATHEIYARALAAAQSRR